MKRFRIALACLTIVLATLGVADEIDSEDRTAVMEGTEFVLGALGRGENEAVLDRIHSGYLAARGGRDVLLRRMDAIYQQAQQSGLSVVEVAAMEPQGPYFTDAEEVLLVPTRTVVESDTKRLTSIGFLLWARPKEGGQWKFVESGEAETAKDIADVFEGFPADTVLPPRSNEIVDR